MTIENNGAGRFWGIMITKPVTDFFETVCDVGLTVTVNEEFGKKFFRVRFSSAFEVRMRQDCLFDGQQSTAGN
jgi:hypothetical protein